ncbi:cytochrome c oxidase subunit 2A [Aquibacillus saliphilus]|uniref:cytochrome c oxidase subunit 2A n=1 Tax=Aquibacillus saliphilus TaxID=1909422 RepID=UPI001CF0175A|nr:cytochrome c oxidase subunit 2A [Aquibacillus saliphilus]
MKTTEAIKSEKQLNNDDEKSLRGTLVSVGFVAAVIVVMWVAVFWIYMERV